MNGAIARGDNAGIFSCQLRMFQLAADLGGGLSASAYLRYWDGSAYQTTSGSDTFTVYDALGIFSGTTGKKGIAAFFPDRGVWVVVQLEC